MSGRSGVEVEELCRICDDRAAGKYYGVLVCDGCKGFFRRSVRNNQVYYCRFDRTCVVGKDNRNQCRYCRLRKCFRLGMKKEAVQNERDRTKPRNSNAEESPIIARLALTLPRLVQADQLVRKAEACSKTHPQVTNGEVPTATATMNEFYDSTKEQLLVLVNWAKYIPAFVDLPVEDKVALLRGHAGDYLLLGLVRRSMHLDNMLLLGNGRVIGMEDEDVISTNRRVITELVQPIKRTNMDDTEFACLKAVIFFDPSAPGLSDPERIRTLRHQALNLLEDYILQRHLEPRGRFGEILLTLPPLRAILVCMLEEAQYRKFFGMAHIDKLLRETLLQDDIDTGPVQEIKVMASPTTSPLGAPSSDSGEDSQSPQPEQPISDSTTDQFVVPNYVDDILSQQYLRFNVDGYA